MHIRHYAFEGGEVPVEIRGSSADTLVFLPGLGVHPKHYAKGLDPLSRRFRVVVPNLAFRRRHALPHSLDGYLELVTAIAEDLAPDAVWAGHSFGALLALLGDRPAVACAPSVPAPVGVPRMFLRAAHQQLREYAGLEGWNGFAFAPQVMIDYVGTAALRPRTLFPVMASLRAPAESLPPRSPRAIVFLCERDELYREDEYRAYFDSAPPAVEVVRVTDCHDWPVVEPALLATRLEESMDRLADAAGGERRASS